MKRAQFKTTVSKFLKKMMNEWFVDKPFIKGLGLSLIDANINKFDDMLQLFEDENGEIDAEGIVENIGGSNEPFKITLRDYSPLLPNRTLLITKEDIESLLRDVKQGEKG